MYGTPPRAWKLIKESYSDTVWALGRVGNLFLKLLTLYLAQAVVELVLLPITFRWSLAGLLIWAALDLIAVFLAAAVYIRLFRFFLLDEDAPRFLETFTTRAYRRFLLWLLIGGVVPFTALGLIGGTAEYLAAAHMRAAMLIVGAVGVWSSLLLLGVICLRLLPFWTALTVDDSEASLGAAWRWTRGHTWFLLRILGALLMLALGVLFLQEFFTVLVRAATDAYGPFTLMGGIPWLLTTAIAVPPWVFAMVFFCAVQSRIYRFVRNVSMEQPSAPLIHPADASSPA